MTGTEIYKRSSTFDREAESIRLHAPQWKLLLAYDGQRSLAEVALSIEVAFAEALPLTETFLEHGWIEEQPITLEQYLKRTGAPNATPVGSAVTPSVVLHQAKAETPLAPANPAPVPPPAQTPVTPPPAASPMVKEIPPPARAPILAPPAPKPSLPPPLKAQPAPVAAIITPPAPPLAPQPARGAGPMRLKAVVDFIVSQVGNSSLGQLVVYRVFLRVPPQLLQAEDIASVHLLNDQSVVKTEALKQAIASSVMQVLKRPLPDSVFAAA